MASYFLATCGSSLARSGGLMESWCSSLESWGGSRAVDPDPHSFSFLDPGRETLREKTEKGNENGRKLQFYNKYYR